MGNVGSKGLSGISPNAALDFPNVWTAKQNFNAGLKTDLIEDESGNQQLGFSANRMVVGRATAWGHIDTNDTTKFVIANRAGDTRRLELDDSLLDLSGIDLSIDNNQSYAVKDSGGTARTGMKLGTDNVLDIGDSAITAVRIQQTDFKVDATKKVYLGASYIEEVSANVVNHVGAGVRTIQERGNYLLHKVLSSVPSDGVFENNDISFYLDESANELKVKVKYSTGTVKTGTVGSLT